MEFKKLKQGEKEKIFNLNLVIFAEIQIEHL